MFILIYRLGLGLFGLIGLLKISNISESTNVFINGKISNYFYFFLLILILIIILIKYISYLLSEKISNEKVKIFVKTSLISILTFFISNIFVIYDIIIKQIKTAPMESFFLGNEIIIKKTYTLQEKIEWYKILINECELEKKAEEIFNLLNFDLINTKEELYSQVGLKLAKIQINLIKQIEMDAQNSIFTKVSNFVYNHPFLISGIIVISAVTIWYFSSEIYSYLQENGSILRDFIINQRKFNAAMLEQTALYDALVARVDVIGKSLDVISKANSDAIHAIMNQLLEHKQFLENCLMELTKLATITGENQVQITIIKKTLEKIYATLTSLGYTDLM